MSSMAIALMAFIGIPGGALRGLFLSLAFPQHHLSSDSKETARRGAGLVAAMAAVVRGLLAGAAKGSFDVMHTGITKMGARTIMLDRVLAQYGPQAKEVRNVAAGLQC